MKRWIHAATVNEMLPVSEPEWVLDKGDEGTHYDLIDPAYGWATIAVYNSSKDGVDMHTVYYARVKQENKVKVGRSFDDLESAQDWAEKQLYQEDSIESRIISK